VATHQQENLPDSILLGHIPGTHNYYCDQHAPIFADLYKAAEELKATWRRQMTHLGRIADNFGPVEKINVPGK
jgi:hypothetical protein